jgi:hypothetical protein
MSPEGTAENGVGNFDIKRHSAVHSGICNIVCTSLPSDESLGYFQMFLWDKRSQQSTASVDVSDPKDKSHG